MHLKGIKLPVTWCEPIQISKHDFETRAPEGKKVKIYKRAMFEHFSPYVQTNGLVLQKSFFSDLKLENQIEEKSIFENREDCLTDIHTNLTSRAVVENFKPGREDCLKKHSYNLDAENKAETERTFNFFDNCRADGLLELIETEDSIIGMYQRSHG